ECTRIDTNKAIALIRVDSCAFVDLFPQRAMHNILLHLLLALVAVLVVGRLLGKLFAYVGQPPVMGEVVGGILLGPSLLGPELSALVLPPEVGPYLGVL